VDRVNKFGGWRYGRDPSDKVMQVNSFPNPEIQFP
jgi:hypothetical protein